MAVELKVPPVGESITEVVIGDWLVAEGAYVHEDAPVVVIESDKVNMEVPAPKSGRLVGVRKASGDSAVVGEVIAEIDESAEAPAEGASAAAPAAPTAPSSAEQPAASPEARVTPAARRMLAEHGLNPGEVPASGPGGRLLKEDVQRAVSLRDQAEAKGPAAPGAPAAPTGPRHTERKRMSPLRKTVARRLVEAQQGAALLTTFNDVDMTAVIEAREKYKDLFAKKHGIRLGFMS
ncbi:MAG: E3 binding domain-containing protein, partial [Myxococcales bacterium]|nr:E3 binding domain-containing protein [Myxococcales bacterium]